eukprot:m.31608 g.31608  ORF g.31608 m.31608 type:complete len:633 (-) comp9714_c0_seq1:149-2047(-)
MMTVFNGDDCGDVKTTTLEPQNKKRTASMFNLDSHQKTNDNLHSENMGSTTTTFRKTKKKNNKRRGSRPLNSDRLTIDQQQQYQHQLVQQQLQQQQAQQHRTEERKEPLSGRSKTNQDILSLYSELNRFDALEKEKRQEEVQKMKELKTIREDIAEVSRKRLAAMKMLQAKVELQHKESIDTIKRVEEESRLQIAMERKILDQEKQVWEDSGEKFASLMPQGRRIFLQFTNQQYVAQLSTLLSTRGGGRDGFFNKLFSGRIHVEHEENVYFFDRDGSVFSHILNFLKGQKVSQKLPPHELEQLQEDAIFYEIWGLVAELNRYIVPLRIGGKTYPLNKDKVVASCGSQSRIGKMVMGELVEPAFVMEARDPHLFEKYVLKKIGDRSFFVSSHGVADDEVALILGEEEFYGVKLLRSSLVPQSIIFESGNKCTAHGNILTKASGRKSSWNGNALSSTHLPMRGLFKFRVTVKKTKSCRIMVGVAPSSFYGEGTDMYNKCGWFFYLYNGDVYSQSLSHQQSKELKECMQGSNGDFIQHDSANSSTNTSGSSHGGNNSSNAFLGTYSASDTNLVQAGGWVEVVVDREASTIAFIVNGQNKGIAYKGVFSKDTDLRACVIFKDMNDSVQVGPIESLP